MHSEAMEFIGEQARKIGVAGKYVLEVGSYNVNGTPRGLFEDAAEYTGIDIRHGPGVDAVLDLTKWVPAFPVDIVVCAETLEHAERPGDLITAMVAALDFGGYLILTCATEPRLPHDVDGRRTGNVHPYQNIDPDWMRLELESNGCTVEALEVHPERGDLYVLAAYRLLDFDSEE